MCQAKWSCRSFNEQLRWLTGLYAHCATIYIMTSLQVTVLVIQCLFLTLLHQTIVVQAKWVMSHNGTSSRVPPMWTPKGRDKSVHISELSTVVDTLNNTIQCDGLIDCCQITMINKPGRADALESRPLSFKTDKSGWTSCLDSNGSARPGMFIILITPNLLTLSIWIQITIHPLSTDGAIVI